MSPNVKAGPALGPMSRRAFLQGSLAATALATLASCGFEDNDSDSKEGKAVLRQAISPVTNFDPAVQDSLAPTRLTLLIGLMEGLVLFDQFGGPDVLPGVAESWDISDDGLKYTFHLRSNAKWSNGDPVTAQDFVWNWKRVLTPGIAGQYAPSMASHPNVGVVNAVAYMNGDITDFEQVGVKALDDRTLEFTLDKINPNFIYLLASWETLPLHPATIEAHPNDWADPKNWVSNGPFVLESFRVNNSVVLVKNPQYWNAAEYHIDRWELTITEGDANAGLLSYQEDEIDLLPVGGNQPFDDPELVSQIVTAPHNLFSFILLMANQNPALHDIRVRKALAMAIDREKLVPLFVNSLPGETLVPKAVPGYENVRPASPYNLDEARRLLAEAGYPNGEGLPPISLMCYTAQAWLEAVAEMWKEGLGIEVVLDIVEAGIYVEKRVQLQPPDYCGWSCTSWDVPPVPTLYNASQLAAGEKWEFFMMPPEAMKEYAEVKDRTDISPGEVNRRLEEISSRWMYPEYAKYRDLARAATAEPNPQRRDELALQACQALEDCYLAVPVLWNCYQLLVKPRVKNFRPWGIPTLFSLRGVTIEN